MSCSSPFEYSASTGISVTTNSNINASGSYTLPGYSIPSTQVCVWEVKGGFKSCSHFFRFKITDKAN